VRVVWNQSVHTDREVTDNRPHKITKRKRENAHTERCGSATGQKCHAKGSRKESKIQDFMFSDTMNVQHAMYDYTGNNWNQWNSNKRFKEKFGSRTRKMFNGFATKDSYTCNITHHTESTAVWTSKPER
jgi:hypothetical protein